MTFWGVEVKPGKPFHHPPSDASGKRLHVSQATLGIGTATTRSVVQCNIGESTPVLLCSLRPDTAESSQLNLEFEESDEVVLSVLGPLSVHLTGYYVQSLGNDLEPHGEDIANTDNELSVDSGNEDDEYEDSFINDGDPGIIPSSPDSSDEATNVKCGRRRLKKKFQLIDSSSEEQGIVKALKMMDNNSEDNLPISLLLSKHKHEEKEMRIINEVNTGKSYKRMEEEEVNKSETSKMEQREVGEVEEMVNKDETTKLEQMKVGEEIVPAVDDVELKSCLPNSKELASKDEAKPKEEKMMSEVVKPLGVQDCSFCEIVMGLSAPSTKQEKTNERAVNVGKSKKKKKHSGKEEVVEAECPTVENENVENLLLKTENDKVENDRKFRKRKKHTGFEAEGPIIESAENDKEHKQHEVKVVNLEQPMLKEENEKQADDESCSVGKSEKKKRKKRRNRSHQEKAEAVPE